VIGTELPYLTFTTPNTANRSTDGGKTYGPPIKMTGEGLDQWMVAGDCTSSPNAGNVYAWEMGIKQLQGPDRSRTVDN
jgi:hypothetical protein